MTTTTTTPTSPAALRCASCGHASQAHDPIGTRFCAATLKGSLDRACICPASAR